jgi:predicted nucleic acid-binding protein
MTTSGKAFVDTNVLIRATIATAPLHKEAQQLIYSQWNNNVELWISRQVVREFIVNVTRPQPYAPTVMVGQLEQQVEMISTLFRVADETAPVTSKLLELLREFPTGGKQIHDANIVATMLVYGIDTLMTQNVEDMRRFVSKISLIPLAEIKS